MKAWRAVVVMAVAQGCSPTTSAPPVTVPAAPCNPLGYGPECTNPWPSSFYLQSAATRTGRKVVIPPNATPLNNEGIAVETAQFETDGYSPATGVVIQLPVPIAVSALTPHSDLPRSLTVASGTLIIDVETRELVVHFAEVDMQSTDDNNRALLLRPMRRLRPDSEYLVVVRRSVVTAADGKLVDRSPGMTAVLDDKPTTSAWLNGHRAHLRELIDVAVGVGVPRDDVLLAFDFHTGSQEAITSNLTTMRDAATTALGADGISIVVEERRVQPYDNVALMIVGRFESPLFLTQDGTTEATLNMDANGLPVQDGTWMREFSVIVPNSVITGTTPAPLMVYGHGLLGSGYGEITAGHVRNLAETLGFVVVATDWTGLSEMDLGIVTGALRDFSTFHRVGSRLQQGIIDTIALTRSARGLIARHDDLKRSDGSQLIDSSTIYYDGNSLGGIMGFTFLSLTPDIERGVLGVGGGSWSLMVNRSSDWPGMALIMNDAYPNPVERQVLLAASQALWDFADPITFGAHLLLNPLPGSTVRHVLAQVGVDDGQVTNLASDLVYGSAGFPLLSQSARNSWGFTVNDDGENGFVYFDFHATNPPPLTNEAAEDTPAHEAVRRSSKAIEQKRRFLRPGGRVELTCEGRCDPD